MRYLKTERGFLRFFADEIEHRPERWHDEDRADYLIRLRRWRERAEQAAPTEYPCIAVAVVLDWGMEESMPLYVYPADAEKLLALRTSN